MHAWSRSGSWLFTAAGPGACAAEPWMILEQIITWLEMTSPDELQPGRPPPVPMELQPGDASLVPLLRATCGRVGEPHGWTSRPAWSEVQWAEHLARADVWAWETRHRGGAATRRVWLQTASTDHANALPNYLGRGFRVVRTEVRRKTVPAEDA